MSPIQIASTFSLATIRMSIRSGIRQLRQARGPISIRKAESRIERYQTAHILVTGELYEPAV